ncbi:MAG: YlxR family protein [Saccharofermentans sp.]|nr:YlxR family protein [Saccharofermentans sp.]
MKKKPQRSCVCCRTTRDKSELLRVVAMADGSIVYDPTGKAPGRGSYLCKNAECIKSELKKAARLSKGLRRAISDEEIENLAKEMLAAAEKAEQ